MASIDNDADWLDWQQSWGVRPDTVYLNHGSFGPTHRTTREARQKWQNQLAEQPMDFFLRHHEEAWFAARQNLADFLDAEAESLTFCDNSTSAMNAVADSFPLSAHDEILLTDQEYGPVIRTWRRACQRAGAAEPRTAALPESVVSEDQVVESIFLHVTGQTRLIVVSHITSPKAIILPVARICREAKARGIPVCVDGPHAPAQIPVSLRELNCDFYTASLHKWLSAPLGTGFLFVAKQWQDQMQPPLASWGRLPPNSPNNWSEEYLWQGTRDPSGFLAIPTAIGLFENNGPNRLRQRMHFLAQQARRTLSELPGCFPTVPDDAKWYGSMASVQLPDGDSVSLQRALWEQHRIEVPIIMHNQQRSVRVSCHLYNTLAQIEQLVSVLADLLKVHSN